LFVTVVGAMDEHRRQLGISVEMPGPHGFAVRNRRTRLMHRRVHRIPHPTFVTIAKRPSLSGTGSGRSIAVSTKTKSKIFLQTGLDW
jgi:hypothetical protein